MNQSVKEFVILSAGLYVLIFYVLADLSVYQRLAVLLTGVIASLIFDRIYVRIRSRKGFHEKK